MDTKLFKRGITLRYKMKRVVTLPAQWFSESGLPCQWFVEALPQLCSCQILLPETGAGNAEVIVALG